jgi:nucleoside-diphosphate-sugar epimerase
MDWRERTWVVTGAGGFLGRRVVSKLQDAGLRTLAASRRDGDYAALRPDGAGSVLLHLADMRDVGAAEAAGEAHVERTRTVARTLAGAGWHYALFASSAAVYGDLECRAHREDEAPAAGGTYARAKLAGEAEFLESDGGAIRLANLYGPGMAPNNVLSDILRQIPGAEPLEVRDGAPVRDFLWVDDAADALVAMVRAEARAVLNAGTGIGTSVTALARRALALAGTPARAIRETAPAGKRSELVLDPAAMAARTGWRATTGLDAGLGQMLEQRT